MNVELNGEVVSLPDGATVATAIEASGAPTERGVAVALDSETWFREASGRQRL